MTKPLTGAAIQILVDEGRVSLDDPVATYIPGFDTDESRGITVEQLMTHTGGLPLTILAGTTDFDDLQAMAAEAGKRGPQFEPGSKFWYSDTGTDVLGAVVEKVTGVTLDVFVGERLLRPLKMYDTFYGFDTGDERWERVANLYVGTRGSWLRFFDPEKGDPFYTYAWGSQTLYSTPMDYAHFLAMWMDGGVFDGERVLSEAAVERMLTPVSVMKMLGSDMRAPSGFPGLSAYYGQMSISYVSDATGETEVLSHSGSDGTYAWAWPAHDLMVLYFTQSRGAASGIRLETVIDYLLVHPERAHTEVPDEYAPYVGTYVANYAQHRNEEFEILYSDGGLTLDVPSQIPFRLREADEEGRWRFELVEEIYITFDTDDEGGVTGLKIFEGSMIHELPRGKAEPEPELDLEAVRKYVGFYEDDQETGDVEVLIQNGHLAVDVPSIGVLELYPPDEEGKFLVRMSPAIWLRFNENDAGKVVSMTVQLPAEVRELPRINE
jgi:CubicO group peptidase (beta-lactamase class C family)